MPGQTASMSWSRSRRPARRIRSTCRRQPAERRQRFLPGPTRSAVSPAPALGPPLPPATKTIPKEMVTIVDRPLIQYAVDEAREAGIEELIFITGRGKSALVDYFDQAFELEATLREKGRSLDV